MLCAFISELDFYLSFFKAWGFNCFVLVQPANLKIKGVRIVSLLSIFEACCNQYWRIAIGLTNELLGAEGQNVAASFQAGSFFMGVAGVPALSGRGFIREQKSTATQGLPLWFVADRWVLAAPQLRQDKGKHGKCLH